MQVNVNVMQVEGDEITIEPDDAAAQILAVFGGSSPDDICTVALSAAPTYGSTAPVGPTLPEQTTAEATAE